MDIATAALIIAAAIIAAAFITRKKPMPFNPLYQPIADAIDADTSALATKLAGLVGAAAALTAENDALKAAAAAQAESDAATIADLQGRLQKLADIINPPAADPGAADPNAPAQ